MVRMVRTLSLCRYVRRGMFLLVFLVVLYALPSKVGARQAKLRPRQASHSGCDAVDVSGRNARATSPPQKIPAPPAYNAVMADTQVDIESLIRSRDFGSLREELTHLRPQEVA